MLFRDRQFNTFRTVMSIRLNPDKYNVKMCGLRLLESNKDDHVGLTADSGLGERLIDLAYPHVIIDG